MSNPYAPGSLMHAHATPPDQKHMLNDPSPVSTKPCGHPIYTECIHEPPAMREQKSMTALPVEGDTKVHPTILPKEDRQEAENISLRILLLIERKRSFMAEIQATIEKEYNTPLKQLQTQMQEFQTMLGDKYGIDFKTHAIESETGRIIRMDEKK